MYYEGFNIYKRKMHDKKSIKARREEITMLQGSYSRNSPASIKETECMVKSLLTK